MFLLNVACSERFIDCWYCWLQDRVQTRDMRELNRVSLWKKYKVGPREMKILRLNTLIAIIANSNFALVNGQTLKSKSGIFMSVTKVYQVCINGPYLTVSIKYSPRAQSCLPPYYYRPVIFLHTVPSWRRPLSPQSFALSFYFLVSIPLCFLHLDLFYLFAFLYLFHHYIISVMFSSTF